MLVGSLGTYVWSNGCFGWFSFPYGNVRLMCAVAVSLPERTKRRCASPAMWHSSFPLNLDGQRFMYNIPLMKPHTFFLCDLKHYSLKSKVQRGNIRALSPAILLGVRILCSFQSSLRESRGRGLPKGGGQEGPEAKNRQLIRTCLLLSQLDVVLLWLPSSEYSVLLEQRRK